MENYQDKLFVIDETRKKSESEHKKKNSKNMNLILIGKKRKNLKQICFPRENISKIEKEGKFNISYKIKEFTPELNQIYIKENLKISNTPGKLSQKICKNLKEYIFSFLSHSKLKELYQIRNKQIRQITRNLCDIKINNPEIKRFKTSDVYFYDKLFKNPSCNTFKEYFAYESESSFFRQKLKQLGNPRQILNLGSSTNTKFLILTGTNKISLWEENKFTLSKTFKDCFFSHAKHLETFRDSSYIACFFFGNISIVNINSLEIEVKIFSEHEWEDVIYSKVSDTFVISTVEGELFFYKLPEYLMKKKFEKKESPILLDAPKSTSRCIKIFEEPPVMLDLFEYSDLILVYCKSDKEIGNNSLKIIDVFSKQVLFGLTGHKAPIINAFHASKMSLNKDIVVSCDSSSVIRVWKLSKKECVGVYRSSLPIFNIFYLSEIRSDLFCVVTKTDSNISFGMIILTSMINHKNSMNNNNDLQIIFHNIKSSYNKDNSEGFSVLNQISKISVGKDFRKEYVMRDLFRVFVLHKDQNLDEYLYEIN